MFTIIAAIGRSNELGKDGDLIWHLPSDMKFFRETTSGHTIIMGRKTFDSLGRVLPNRHHVVLTHADDSYFPEEVEVVHSFAEVYTKYRDVDEDVFIIGGGEIYRLFFSYAEKMYLTQVNEIYFNADTFFPEIDARNWEVRDLQEIDEDGHQAVIREYIRKK